MKIETIIKKNDEANKEIQKKFDFLDNDKYKINMVQTGDDAFIIFVLDYYNESNYPIHNEKDFKIFKHKYLNNSFNFWDFCE